ncbi:MAG: zinc ribbon domain-containing protein [Acidobacteriia bacterium]|nr:zinc ribbon domain-containing protein [Terriglobia bacterium]
MPIYDYICKKCDKKFTAILALSEYEKKKAKCPECGSKKVEQEIQPFFVVTSKKS